MKKCNIKEEINIIKNDMNLLKEESNKLKNDMSLLKEKNTYLEEQLKLISDKLNNNNNIDKDKLIPKDNKKLNTFIKFDTLPDIMEIPNGIKYNNVLYYNENINELNTIYKDSDFFERNTLGAFILSVDLDSLYLIKKEILTEIRKSRFTKFNLILGEFNIQNFKNFINQNQEFLECIQNACIYHSKILNRYLNLDIRSLKIVNIYHNKEDVKNFINTVSSGNIKPFPLKKLITYQDYLDKYKKFHYKISKFYGDLSLETFNKNIEKIKSLINAKDKKRELRNKNKNRLFEGFLTFDVNIKGDVDQLIIKEWTKDTIYDDLNKWLSNLDMYSFEAVAYFASRIMYSLNTYGQKKKVQ